MCVPDIPNKLGKAQRVYTNSEWNHVAACLL